MWTVTVETQFWTGQREPHASISHRRDCETPREVLVAVTELLNGMAGKYRLVVTPVDGEERVAAESDVLPV